MRSKILHFAISSVIGSLSFAAQAIERQSPDFWNVGDFFVIPSIALTETHDDNIFLQSSNERSSWITEVTPKVRVAYEGEYSMNTFDVEFTSGTYHSSSDDDYLDTRIQIGSEVFPSDKLQYGASLAYIEGHDARGTERQQGPNALVFSAPQEYELIHAKADVEYGTRVQGAARLEVGLDYQDKQYQNFRQATAQLDREETGLTAGLFYYLAPNTSILIEGSYTNFDYDTATLDSIETQAMVGLEWDATYQTTGFAKVGYSEKDFDDATRQDADEPAWEIGVDWRPLDYSKVTFRAAKGFDEGEGTGTFSNVEVLGIDWNHDWYDHIGTVISLESSSEDFGGSAREDEYDTFSIRADFQYNPWLLMSAGYLYEDRDSNQAGFDYKDNQFNLNFAINWR